MAQIMINPSNDIYISEAYPKKSFNEADYLFVGRYSNERDRYRFFLRFNISELHEKIPKNSSISSIVLRLTVFRNEIPENHKQLGAGVYRLTGEVDLTNITWADQPGFAEAPEAMVNLAAGTFGNIDINLTGLVKGWYEKTIPNYGIVIKGDEGINNIIGIRKSNYLNGEFGPKLIIDYVNERLEDQKTFRGLYNYRKRYYESFLNDHLPKESRIINERIKSKKVKGIVVYPQAVFWEPVQRPHQILREFAKKGYLCFFCDPPMGEFFIKEEEENLFVINNEAYLLPVLRTKPVIVLCSWLMQMAWADLLPNRIVWYDILDKIEFFTMYDEGMLERHEVQVREADFVSYSGKLLKRYVESRSDAVYLPNGCNVDDFTRNDNNAVPQKISGIVREGKPIIGYFGALEEWFDAELINGLAKRNPSWNFVIIGKIGIEKEKLDSPNILLTGMVPYKELTTYARYFDVALIPFIVNDLTNCVSPVKFFEYAALGKPVVSVPIVEMNQYESSWVCIAGDMYSFEERIKTCLAEDVKNTAKKEGVELARENQWSSRVDAFEKALLFSPKGWTVFSGINNIGTVAVMTPTFLDFNGEKSYAGGAERYLLDLHRVFSMAGLKMDIYQCGNFPWMRRLKDIDIISLSNDNLNAKVFSVENLFSFSKIFYSYTIDNTVLNLYSPFFAAYPLNANPSIGISHGVAWDSKATKYDNGAGFWAGNKRYIESAKHCDVTVSVDTNTACWFQTIDYDLGSRMKVITNYVDTNEFKPRDGFDSPRQNTVILFPRRLYEARGLYMLLEIIDSILERHKNAEFHFVGRGVEADTRFIAEKQLKWGERVKWYEKLPEEMPEVYRNSDITLIPTLYCEGTSLSCLEAMASGNAVIATRVGGLPNLIINGLNGFLIEPDARDLEAHIDLLLSDKNKLMQFKKKALEASSFFTKQIWQDKWLDVIRKMVGEENRGVVRQTSLVEIYLDDLSGFPPEKLGLFITRLLQKGHLLYIRIRNNKEIKHVNYGRLQWLKWDEESFSKPDVVIADEKSAPSIKGRINVDYVLTRELINEAEFLGS